MAALKEHRETVSKLIASARAKYHPRAGIYYMDGYCDNSRCDVREVLIRVKDYDETPSQKEFRCPACQSLLLFGTYLFDVGIKTATEYGEQTEQEARSDVADQLRKEKKGFSCSTAAEIFEEWHVTLDELEKMFRERKIERPA
jgi:hypothetical protein